MTEISVPRTPSPALRMRQGKSVSMSASTEIEETNTIDSQSRSTPPPAPIDLTPPPSTQIPRKTAKMTDKHESSLASPPPTSRSNPPISQGALFGEVPSKDAVDKMPEEQVRSLVAELLVSLNNARTVVASTQLQHQLLTIETNETVQRAEVEREMALREHQVLQESPRRHGQMSPHSPHASAQRHLDLALKKCRQLQFDNEQLERRMHAARKLIRNLSEKNEDLTDDISRLRLRIKQNRDHLNAMRSSGTISVNGTPLTNFVTPNHHRTPRTPLTARSSHAVNNPPSSQGAFDALLIAGEVLNNEANSVPSTPTRGKPRKINQPQHMRGAHSLSSLPSTPNRSRPMTADNALLTPTPHRTANHRASLTAPSRYIIPPSRKDRDSTVSASEDEDEQYKEYIPASQASQRATDMLRQSMNSKDGSPKSGSTHGASQSLRREPSQSKISGQVKKFRGDGMARIDKRVGSGSVYEDTRHSPKKVKMGNGRRESVGLGIERWEAVEK
ncbi:MAG: hypothetical protein Q9185_000305 [Variospora sp. 1 TL-2023]